MVNQDILGCLRNAIARGSTLNEAKKSLLNAGYSEKEVRETASLLENEPIEMVPENSVKKEKTRKTEIKEPALSGKTFIIKTKKSSKISKILKFLLVLIIITALALGTTIIVTYLS